MIWIIAYCAVVFIFTIVIPNLIYAYQMSQCAKNFVSLYGAHGATFHNTHCYRIASCEREKILAWSEAIEDSSQVMWDSECGYLCELRLPPNGGSTRE